MLGFPIFGNSHMQVWMFSLTRISLQSLSNYSIICPKTLVIQGPPKACSIHKDSQYKWSATVGCEPSHKDAQGIYHEAPPLQEMTPKVGCSGAVWHSYILCLSLYVGFWSALYAL